MEFLDEIESETILICNDSVKDKILFQNRLLPIKFFSLNKFIKKYCFDYDENTIKYIIGKYNVKYEIAEMYINNLYYVKDINYGVKKLDFLVSLKKELILNNLLIFNDNFKNYIKNINIILYDVRINNFIIELLDGLNYKIINRKYNNYPHYILKFPTMDMEVEYVAGEICKLIDSGININNIKLMNVDEGYYNTIFRIFSLFNLKVNILNERKLISYPVVSKFIEYYQEHSLDDSIMLLDKNMDGYEELINLINKYLIYDDKDLIVYKIMNSSVCNKKYENAIEIVNYLDYISEDFEYIFLLGFNDGIIPNSYKDIDYISDNIKHFVNLDDTRIMNKWLTEDIKNKLGDIKNLTITYKDRDMKKTYYPSSLSYDYLIKDGSINYNNSYSRVYNMIKLGIRYDDYLKYGYISDDFDLLNNNYKIKYNSFNNKYKKINRKFDGLKLSYSKMQIYNKCAFRYYLNEILKLDIYQADFSTIIGSMVHHVMEYCLRNNDMDIEKHVNLYLEDKEFSKKELFFLEKYKSAIHELMDQVMLEREYSSFNSALYEEYISIDYLDNVSFSGKIDKILYHQDNDKTYVSIVDYKTGMEQISLNCLEYGINIQLPIYLYLASKLDFKNIVYTGFYLQKFNLSDKDYRLVGYSNSDIDVLGIQDSNYSNSKIIKGLKTKKDGSFYSSAKVLSNDEIDEIKNIVNDKILEVINNIKNNEFDINPKVIDNKNIACMYCKFRDICFMTNNDLVKIKSSQFKVGDMDE